MNRFDHTWFEQLHLLTAHLSQSLSSNPNQTQQFVQKTINHYSELYRFKSLAAANSGVLTLFSAPWATPLERSLYWITGFRPTTIFHLIYTESTSRFESSLANYLSGQRTGDLSELSAGQLTRVSDLQCETVEAENEISERLSEWQMGVAGGVDWGSVGNGEVDGRIEGLRTVVEAADQLRIQTLTRVLGLLLPLQQAQFLVAFSELLFGLRSWGLTHD